MTCSAFIEGFTDYIDGEADASTQEAARRHRDACASCRRYETVYLEGRSLLQDGESLEVGDDFHPRLQHRLYHVDDERALARSRPGSASAAMLLGVAALAVAAAWTPALLDEPEVELSPIVVDRPAPRPLGLRAPFASLLPASMLPTGAALDLDGDDLWRQPSALLFEYAPIRARYRQQAGVVRTGLQ